MALPRSGERDVAGRRLCGERQREECTSNEGGCARARLAGHGESGMMRVRGLAEVQPDLRAWSTDRAG